MIQFFHVGKRYPGGQAALEDLTFDIPRGQFLFLTGASGAGKTTLLKMIFREEVPTSGQIVVNGRNVASIPPRKVPFLRRSIGVVFQDFRLIPRKTVFENVAYLPRILGLDTRTQKKAAYQALRRVGLAHRLNSFPPELSGGEQQRVAIARALINEPEILIADEPTGNLDPELSREILRLFLAVNLRGTTVILATHDRDTIERVGGRVLTLERGRLLSDVELAGTDPPRLDLPAEPPPEGAEAEGEPAGWTPFPDREPRSASETAETASGPAPPRLAAEPDPEPSWTLFPGGEPRTSATAEPGSGPAPSRLAAEPESEPAPGRLAGPARGPEPGSVPAPAGVATSPPSRTSPSPQAFPGSPASPETPGPPDPEAAP